MSNLERWEELLEKTEIVLQLTESLVPLSADQLLEFETQAEILLPLAYKEFCQVFGQGYFHQASLTIDCPLIHCLKKQLISNSEILEATKSLHSHLTEIQELLSSAYLFGFGEGILFVFDLRIDDKSSNDYRICAVDDNGQIYQLGQDFFEFIHDFCFSKQISRQAVELLADMRTVESQHLTQQNVSRFTPTPLPPISL